MSESRMRDFKYRSKDNSEMRGRRRDVNVELRKNKRVEQTLKRRNVTDEPSAAPLSTSKLVNRAGLSVADIPSILQGMSSSDTTTQLQSTNRCRMLLSKEKNPPIDDVIKAGLVPRLVQLLAREDNPKLQFEAAWALTNIASGNDRQTRAVVDANAVPRFIKLLTSTNDDVREQAVWALGNIAGDSAELRDMTLKLNILPPLLTILNPNSKMSMLRNATWTLSNLCRGKKPQPDFAIIKHAVPTLGGLLRFHDEEVMTDAAWALSYVTDGDNYKIQAVIDAGIVPRLVELLAHPHSSVQTPALRAVGNIVTGDDSQTQMVLDNGALAAFYHLLSSGKENIRKETCWTLSNITAGTPAQIQAVIDANMIPALVHILQHSEFRTRKEAAWALANLTTGGTAQQTLSLVHMGALRPLIDLLQVQDAKIVLLVLDGLSNILKHGQQPDGTNPVADAVEEAGGMDVIEQLQSHDSDEIYRKALLVIDTYFSDDAAEAEQALVPTVAANGAGFAFGAAPTAVPAFSF
eukprot:m.496455 g.496455  ORF g.496455 m.496455 type:complete len:521 (-) comp47742_c0_seq1:289-1851(-)